MPKSRRKRGRPFHNAPLQGMGETFDWIVNDVQSIAIPLTGPGIFGIRGCVDVNGFSWSVTQNGGLIGISSNTTPYNQALYGQNNAQFQRLSTLWQEYRTDAVSYQFQPVAAGGSINMTSMVSVVDESGQFQGTPPLVDVAEKYSSMRRVSLHTPYRVLKQRLRLNKWLGQTQDRSWLQTQAPGTSQIIREVYPTPLTDIQPNNSVGRTPALGFVGGFNSTQAAGTSAILGVIKFVTRFVFRQRRPLDSDPFLDQTLLYSKDGKDFSTKLTPEKVAMIVEHFNLHEQEEEQGSDPEVVTSDSVPIAQPSLDLTRSQIISLFQNSPPVERVISAVCHKPAHMKERIGEASNPGPVSTGGCQVSHKPAHMRERIGEASNPGPDIEGSG